MKKEKNLLLIIITFIFIFIVLIHFLFQEKSVDTSNQNDKDVQKNNQLGKSVYYTAIFKEGRYIEPVRITTARVLDGNVTFKNGETMKENVHTRWAKDTLGIEIDTIWHTDTLEAFAIKIRLLLASNEELPDIIPTRDMGLAQELIDSGLFMPIDELFRTYASDIWKEAAAIDPNVWTPFMRDGLTYGIPVLDFTYNNDHILWIREDWLEKLELEVPTTMGELEKVLHAFTYLDPNGTKQHDTYGLAFSYRHDLEELSWIFGAYGTIPSFWHEDVLGNLTYGSVQPEMKDALRIISEWTKKGYVPKEASLLTWLDSAELFVTGRAGIISGPHWMPTWPLNELAKNIPGAKYKPIKIPAGPTGQAMRWGNDTYNGVILINKNMKHPDAFFVYQNYLFDNYANPIEGSPFEFGLAKDYDWTLVDGRPTTVPEKIPGGWANVTKYTLMFDGARIPDIYMSSLAKFHKGKKPETPFETIIHGKFPPAAWEAAAILLEQKDISTTDKFQGPPTKTMVDIWGFLEGLEKQMLTNIMTGSAEGDTFDEFVERWNSKGGQMIVQEVNEWYQETKYLERNKFLSK
ncbi:MAG: extracellular solute-binding protein [Anaerobacillus sp.]|uniref:extracellular solute-binding protein n=1 Tax=Anaerobacillus sp. TaxID=1872506 RepID=UPI00391CC1CA